ncbi:MAG: type IX secretion system membrane protein PorP/SprF [Bacteroidetes bacterium]|nr:type IX secretion system membrane protein PorP/SprF [Bacteroidota bacterium]
MKKLKVLLAGVFCACHLITDVEQVQAQDPQFSQYYANKLWLSPAFAGSGIGPRISSGFRSQWAGIPGAFRTMNVSFDTPIYFGNVQNGVGINVMADQAGEGALTLIEPTLSYSFLAELSDNAGIRLGLQGGIRYNSIDFYALRFPDQLAPGVAPGSISQEFVNRNDINANTRMHEEVGAGVLFYNKYLFLGGTAKHITQPQQRLLNNSQLNSVLIDPVTGEEKPVVDPKLPLYVAGFAGATLPLDSKGEGTIALMPTVLYRMQGPFTQFDAGMYFKYEPLVLGVYYRTLGNDALIAIVGIDYNHLRIGYSYDYTMSDITNRVSGGSHEISISYEFETVRKKRKPKPKMSCPQF